MVDLIRDLEKKSDLSILLDWSTLTTQGWNRSTIVPGNIIEPTIGDVLKEVAQSMNLTLRAVDENTLEITTFDRAAVEVELEIYHFGKLLKRLNEEQASRMIANTLGEQLQAPYIRNTYEPKCQCYILVAPQSLQRQMAAIVKKLEEL